MGRKREQLESVEVVLLPDPDDEVRGPDPEPRSGNVLATRLLAVAGVLLAILLIAVVNRSDAGVAGTATPNAALLDSTLGPESSLPPTPSSALDPSPSSAETTTDQPVEASPVLDDCNNELDYPKYRAQPATRPIKATVVIGGGVSLNLANGQVTQPAVTVEKGSQVTQLLRHDDLLYVAIQNCTYSDASRVVSVASDGTVTDVPIPNRATTYNTQLTELGGRLFWQYFGEEAEGTGLLPLDGGDALTFPVNFYPFASDDDRFLGITYDEETSSSHIAIVDIGTEKTTRLTSPDPDTSASVMALDGDTVVWTDQSEDGTLGPIQTYSLRTNKTTTSSWTPPAEFQGLALSADGRYLAGHLRTAGSATTVDFMNGKGSLVVVDLKLGERKTINALTWDMYRGGVTMAFAPTSNDLVIGVTAEDGTHVLTYQPGEDTLFEQKTTMAGTNSPYFPMLVY